MTDTGVACFLAVCRYKTGSRAAEALYITQSSLTTRLKNLERELGGQLFHRKKGGREMTLTDAGKAFYPLALQYEKLMEQMRGVFGGEGAVLRVSSYNSLGTYLLPPVYERFIQKYPQIRLDIQDMELEQACRGLESGTTDLSFTSGVVSNPALVQTPVFVEPMVLVCEAGAGYPEHVCLLELPAEEEVYIEWSTRYARWHQQTFGTGRQPKISISIMTHLRQFMSRAQSWAIVPVSVAVGLERDCGVRCLGADVPLPKREVSVLSHADGRNREPIADFCCCLREILQAYPQIRAV